MIGKLTGIVDSCEEDHVILDVGGVGYVVGCPASTLSKLAVGQTASLLIETRITDETIRLYGFSSAEERAWFRLLQTVQSVGARVALNVLSALSPRDLERALTFSDKAAIGRAQGVGPKLALRIVTELKDKVPARSLRESDDSIVQTVSKGPEADAVAALTGLGYSASRASEVVARVSRDIGKAPVETLIRECLRHMAK